jgi:hypothetical protein
MYRNEKYNHLMKNTGHKEEYTMSAPRMAGERRMQ